MITANRYHDICCGHRVYGHESKCAHLHGHNYRFHFSIKSKEDKLDSIGRVLDFSVIKTLLCEWLEHHWDHKFLIWEKDPLCSILHDADPSGVIPVSFNPTAENIAEFFLRIANEYLLDGSGCILTELTIEETRKCSITIKQ